MRPRRTRRTASTISATDEHGRTAGPTNSSPPSIGWACPSPNDGIRKPPSRSTSVVSGRSAASRTASSPTAAMTPSTTRRASVPSARLALSTRFRCGTASTSPSGHYAGLRRSQRRTTPIRDVAWLRIEIVESEDQFGRSIAVIGSGVAGLTAAYVLSARNRVTLFEADTRLGGHAHTHFVDGGDGNVVGVDSAFLVHNDRTYPTLCRLFADLGIATRDTDMSMSVRDDDAGLEYAGARGIGGLFPSLSSSGPAPLSPDARGGQAVPPRGHRAARRRVGRRRRTARRVRRPARVLRVLRRALHDAARRRRLVVRARRGDALSGPLPVRLPPAPRHAVGVRLADVADRRRRFGDLRPGHRGRGCDEVVTGMPVRSVQRVADGVSVTAGDGAPRRFDAAVIATHPDQALADARRPDRRPNAPCSAPCRTPTNHAQLHTDTSVLPRRPRARASWNYLATPDTDNVLVTYDITRLMRLSGTAALPGHPRRPGPRRPGHRHRGDDLRTPALHPGIRCRTTLLPTLDDDRVVFAGAYHGWGFHEDGAASGLRAARRLGADWPAGARLEAVRA